MIDTQPRLCDSNDKNITPLRKYIEQNETNTRTRTSPRSSPRSNVALAKLLSSYIRLSSKMK